jgi:hypothetical protein
MLSPAEAVPDVESNRNAVTKTSFGPDSFETYATQRSSGESCASF